MEKSNTTDNTIQGRLNAVQNLIETTEQYQPSGKYSSSAPMLYLLTALLAVIVGQLLIAISDGITGFSTGWMTDDNFTRWFIMIGSAIGFYGVSGFLMGKIIDLAAIKSENRSLKIANLAGILTVIVSYFGRLIITYNLSNIFDLGIRMDDMWDRASDYWIYSSIGFIALLIGTMMTVSNRIFSNPYCEDCKKYAQKISLYLKDNMIVDFLQNMKIAKDNSFRSIIGDVYGSTDPSEPNITLTLSECTDCHKGYLTLVWNYFLDEVKKKQKGSQLVFSAALDSEGIKNLQSFVDKNR